jgi:hypothetical protein
LIAIAGEVTDYFRMKPNRRGYKKIDALDSIFEGSQSADEVMLVI